MSQVISALNGIDYDSSTKKLYVEIMNGATYVYNNVDPVIYRRMLNSKSKENFFNRFIKKNPFGRGIKVS